GAVGSEIGQALAQLGIKVVGIEASQWVAGLSDPVVNQEAIEILSQNLDLYMETEAQQLSLDSNGKVRIELNTASAVTVDQVLVSLGRQPNLDDLGLEVLGIHSAAELKQQLNPQTMQVGNWPLFVAGDCADFRAILHEASDEGTIAGYNAVHEPIAAFKRRLPLRIVFTQPQIITVGTPFNQIPATAVIGERSFKVQGRTKIMGQNQGHLRVYADRDSGQLLGAEMMVAEAEYMGHFLALALEHTMTVAEITRTPFYHPTVMEGLDNALATINKELGHPQPILAVKDPQ
ncbi:MAG: FAD-dependent oxidoreductase, partial [Pseudomonadota bacterium]|nr:FAD-dependent oxidoreductase [Pseudomonadota bacterium]